MQNIRPMIQKSWSDMWGANALRGHLLIMALCAIFPFLDRDVLHIIPDIDAALVAAALIVIVPLQNPARGMDKKNERVQLWILTFGSSFVFGVIAGTIFASKTPMQLGVSSISISLIVEAVAVVSMFMSYFGCGFLSRKYAPEMADYLGFELPQGVCDLMVALINRARPMLVDDLLKAIADRNSEKLRIGGDIWLDLADEIREASPLLRSLALRVFREELPTLFEEWESDVSKFGSDLENLENL